MIKRLFCLIFGHDWFPIGYGIERCLRCFQGRTKIPYTKTIHYWKDR